MKRMQSRVMACAAAMMLAAGSALAAPPPKLTLEQAIAQVQQDTGGTVLSAEPRKLGRRTEYRIKVLTPEGHVQVIVVSSDAAGLPVSTPATKNPAARGTDNKEKH
jgi:hypothetical protein